MIQRKKIKSYQMVITDPDVEFSNSIYVELCKDLVDKEQWYVISDSAGDEIRLTSEELEEILKATKELG